MSWCVLNIHAVVFSDSRNQPEEAGPPAPHICRPCRLWQDPAYRQSLYCGTWQFCPWQGRWPLLNLLTHKNLFYCCPLKSLLLAYKKMKPKCHCLKTVHVKNKPLVTGALCGFLHALRSHWTFVYFLKLQGLNGTVYSSRLLNVFCFCTSVFAAKNWCLNQWRQPHVLLYIGKNRWHCFIFGKLNVYHRLLWPSVGCFFSRVVFMPT